jgi:hypothetical protein
MLDGLYVVVPFRPALQVGQGPEQAVTVDVEGEFMNVAGHGALLFSDAMQPKGAC